MGPDGLRGVTIRTILRGMSGAGIYIHAGAHRTGTSSFQYFLSANAERIRAAGYDLVYPGRDGIPGGRLRLRLPGPSTGPKRRQDLREFLAEEMQVYSTAPDRPLILSEENIPGRMLHFYGGAFFPAIRRRLRPLKEVLPAPVRRLVYVVRPYDELFVSAYRKRSEDNPVDSFDDIRPALMEMPDGWPHVISALRDVLEPEELVVATYARRGSNTDMLVRLVPELRGLDLEEPGERLNISATDAALVALQEVYAEDQSLSREEWQEIVAEHADDRTDLGYAGFSEAETAQLQDRYAADIAEIRGMPGVTLVE